jgi:ElaB/YqjD/DUF883 family membrane-anchored ribosome-binding protein
MKLLRTAQRREEEMASDFAQLIEEGRALLGEMVGKPVQQSTRDTLDQVSAKVSDLQDYAVRAARQGVARGTKYGKQADRYLRDNPWPTLAGGIALGIIAAALWSQRR